MFQSQPLQRLPPKSFVVIVSCSLKKQLAFHHLLQQNLGPIGYLNPWELTEYYIPYIYILYIEKNVLIFFCINKYKSFILAIIWSLHYFTHTSTYTHVHSMAKKGYSSQRPLIKKKKIWKRSERFGRNFTFINWNL